MGSIIGHRIDYNGVGALRGQRHIHNKNLPEYPPPPVYMTLCFPYITFLKLGMENSPHLRARVQGERDTLVLLC